MSTEHLTASQGGGNRKAYISMKSKESYLRKQSDGRYEALLKHKLERYRMDEDYRKRVVAYNRARYHEKKARTQVAAC